MAALFYVCKYSHTPTHHSPTHYSISYSPLTIILIILVALLGICQVEVTKFEDLEETHAEVRLKQNLWKSQQDWETDYQLWLTVSYT